MKNIKLLTLLLLLSFTINAQMLTNAGVNSISGGFANANNSLSFSVGQTIIGNYTSNNTMITNGTLQPEIINIIPITQMSNNVCGNMNFVRTSSVICLPVAGATQYDWQFSNGAGVYATKTTTTNYVLLHSVTPSLNWGTNWNIKVRAKIGNIVGPYSNDCSIGIMPDPSINGVPQTQLRIQDCNKQNYRLNADNRIISNPVSGAIQYEFEFSSASTGSVIATKLVTSNVVYLNTVTPSLVFPAQYNVRVRARIGSTWGVFGTPCLIGIIGLNREEVSTSEESESMSNILIENKYFDVMVMPNPFSEQAMLNIHSNNNELVKIEVFDIVGNRVWSQTLQSNINTEFGLNYAQGTYIIKALNQEGEQAIFKFIKSK